MKKIILIFFLIISFNKDVFAAWDLLFYSTTNVDIRMEAVSLPFEGLNRYINDYARVGIIQNGSIYRAYYGSTNFKDSQIVVHQKLNTTGPFNLASCFAESNNFNYSRWGFAKYLITITNLSDTNKTIRFYLNTLDSKLGIDTVPDSGYHGDFGINYIASGTIPYVKFCVHCAQADSIVRYVYQSTEPQEVTMWDLFYNRSTPLEKKFLARSSPFPFSVFTATTQIRNVIVGTKVTFDTVLQNYGDSDRFGYNTQNDPYYSNQNPIILPFGSPGNTYVTPGKTFDPDPNQPSIVGIKITAESGDSLILRRNKRLWIYGTGIGPFEGGDTLFLRNGSYLQLDTNAEIFTHNGGVLIDSGSSRSWKNLSCHRAFEGTSINFFGSTHTVSNGGFIVIDGDADLKLGNNTTLSFDGPGSFLKLQPNSDVILGQNAKLVFKNGARIIADSADFISYNGTASWKGIVLENSGEDSITYCNFSDADTAIYIKNADICDAKIKKVIVGNTFENEYIVMKNIFRCNFSNNTLSGNSYNTRLLTVTNNIHPSEINTCEESEDPEIGLFGINIVNNSFTGGIIQMDLNCLASSLTQFYVAGNFFNGTSGSPGIGIVTNKVSGDIKNNIFTSDVYDYAVRFYQSDLNVLGNEVDSESGLLEIITSSTANLAPVNNSGNLYWYGGKNTLNAGYTGIIFDAGSELYLDYGSNCISVPEGEAHVFGTVTGSCVTGRSFAARKNNWTPHPPVSDINCSSNNVPLLYTPNNSTCDVDEPEAIDYEIIDKGDGYIDSVIITSSGGSGGVSNTNNFNKDIQTNDEGLYAQALINRNDKDYNEAISLLKELLDDYDTSKYVNSAVSELFLNYTLKDSGVSQTNTTSMFNELEDYLEDKMEQYQSNSSFIEKAYSIYLMCLTKTLDYNEAISGYENIISSHPDTTRRLLASWDRSAVTLLQQGSGGGDNNLSLEQKLKKLFRDKPVHKLANKVFKRMMTKALDINVNSKNFSKNVDRKVMKGIESRIIRFNPETREELDSKISKDFEMLLALDASTNSKEHSSIPTEYKLYQNYPNPFNPITIINYELGITNFVSLKVYDLLGKEVLTLVSENKQPGNHSATFDGSNLPSGMYFYRLSVDGNVVDTKRMALVK